jgi:hypothetical protein
MLGHLKLHTIGDVDLSHSLGIALGVLGTSPSMTTTPMDGTTVGCVASLKDSYGEKNKRWRPCVEFHSDSAKRLVMMYSMIDMY